MPQTIVRNGFIIDSRKAGNFRPRPDQGQISFYHIPKLRQFIDPENPEPPSDRGHLFFSVPSHSPEFSDENFLIVLTHSLLFEKNRAAVINFNKNINKRINR